MAKGKHAPAPGAVRPDKIIHPKSRKAVRMQQKAQKRAKIAASIKSGATKLQAVGEKLNWFKENLEICVPEGEKVTCQVIMTFAEAYLSRFEEELEQIKLKNSIGEKNSSRRQHASRLDTIEHTMKLEKEEFMGCGLEMPNLFDQENLDYFRNWNGELRYVQNIKVKKFRRKELEEGKFDVKPNDMEVE